MPPQQKRSLSNFKRCYAPNHPRIIASLSGTIIIETIFALPGIGRLFIDSLGRLDYQVVQSLVVVLSALVVIANLITDLVYAVVDPRIRMG